MLFSEHFGLIVDDSIDFFDPILDYDTRLFLDPFLVSQSHNSIFINSYAEITAFFEQIFSLAAKADRKPGTQSYERLIFLNLFPEAEEICLGYANESIKGAGSGRGFAKLILEAIFESIDEGAFALDRFEELGIFHRGIGPDRISDITANIIKRDLIIYTQKICLTYNVPFDTHEQLVLIKTPLRWARETFKLPTNPFTRKPIILVPKGFLHQFPEINDHNFYSYCVDYQSQQLRVEFNTDLLSKIDKNKIVEIAKRHREWVSAYVAYKEKLQAAPYDLNNDPAGLYQWVNFSREYVAKHSLQMSADSDKSFNVTLNSLTDEFRKFIELRGGHKLLWDDVSGNPKREEASQLLFYGIARLYCQANNIDVSREIELGRGSVDFKFAQGYSNRCLLEVKLARNTKFWNGLEKQLVYYMEAEGTVQGYFMVVYYNNKEYKKIKDILNKVEQLNKKLNLKISAVVIDATLEKPSASNL